MQKKYVFLYLKTGGGHLAPARSLTNYIHAKHGHKARVTLHDGFLGVNKMVKTIVEDGYRQSQAQAVWVFELLYALNKIPLVAHFTAMVLSYFIKPALQMLLEQEKPDRIVVFHFFLIRPVMKILQSKGLTIPVTVVVTDPFTAHPIWFLNKKPGFIVFSDRLRKYTITRGIRAENIKMFPFILDEKFTQPLSPVLSRSMKENLGFDPSKRLILILGGGDGIPRGKKILLNFLRKSPAAQVAIVCGKNHTLYKKAWKLKNRYNFTALKIYGYVDFIYELINIADVVVTKCGASTFMEILISGKIPVINNYIWEQEKGNMQYVCSNKMGIYEKDVSKLPEKINELIYNPHIYEFYKKNITHQKLVNGTAMVSDFIVSEISQQP